MLRAYTLACLIVAAFTTTLAQCQHFPQRPNLKFPYKFSISQLQFFGSFWLLITKHMKHAKICFMCFVVKKICFRNRPALHMIGPTISASTSGAELMSCGLTETQSALVSAAISIGQELCSAPLRPGERFGNSREIYVRYRARFYAARKEFFVALNLNSNTRTSPHIKEHLLENAVLGNAKGQFQMYSLRNKPRQSAWFSARHRPCNSLGVRRENSHGESPDVV